MRPYTALLALLSIVTGLLLQRSAFAQIPLPGAGPELLVIVVVAFALFRGPFTGMLVGFAAGLLADLSPPAAHHVGREAFVLCLTGYLAGLLQDEVDRSALAPMFVVAVGTAFAVLLDAGLGGLFGDARVTWGAVTRVLPATVLYDVVLTPFIVPVLGALDRRLDLDARRR